MNVIFSGIVDGIWKKICKFAWNKHHVEDSRPKIMKRFALLLIIAMATSLSASSQTIKELSCYLFGFAASFNDSTVYITDIQQLDSAYFYNHEVFLYGRDGYAQQLKNHLKGLGFTTPTAIIFFSDKKKEIEKKYLKLKNRYSKDGAYNFKYLTSQDFLFTTVKPDESLLNRKETTSKKKK